jgi:hypothetical protein
MFDPYDAGKLAEDAILSHSRVLEVGGSVERKPYTPPLLLSGNGDLADAATSLASVVSMATAPFTDATGTLTSTSITSTVDTTIANTITLPVAANHAVAEVGMRSAQRIIGPQTIDTLNRVATSSGITLNSLLLGTLSMHLRACSGQDHFAINQTYLGRRPGQLQAVGSYSGHVPMEFHFGDESSLLSTCQHVFAETMRHMAAPDIAIATAKLESNISYELNDVRPMTQPSSAPGTLNVVLGDLFFLLNQYADGFTAVLSYDLSKYQHTFVEQLLDGWLQELEVLGTFDHLPSKSYVSKRRF